MQEPTSVLLRHAKEERFSKRKRAKVEQHAEDKVEEPDFIKLQAELKQDARDPELADYEFLAGLALQNESFKPTERKWVEPSPAEKRATDERQLPLTNNEKLFSFEVIDSMERHKYLVTQPGPFHMYTALELEQDPFILESNAQPIENSFKQVSNIPSAPSEAFECAAAGSSVAIREEDEVTLLQQPLRPVSERRINRNNDVLVFRKSETDEFIGGTYGNNFFGGVD